MQVTMIVFYSASAQQVMQAHSSVSIL